MIGLPEGPTHRPITPDDVDAITALIAAAELHDDGVAEIDRNDVANIFERSDWDPAENAVLVFEAESPIAWAEVHTGRAEADVRPDHRGTGIGSALMAWTEERARALGCRDIGQTVTDATRGAAELFAARGYEPSWTSWILEIEVGDEPPPVPGAPDGISLRAYESSVDEHAVHRLVDDAFREWPGREPVPFEEWAGFVIRHHAFSPELSSLAFDGDELVGVLLSCDYPAEVEGWIQQLATKATHRHRGIALMHRTFSAFRERGKHRCGVSTDSRTGALSLYERVGMHVRRSYTRYALPL